MEDMKMNKYSLKIECKNIISRKNRESFKKACRIILGKENFLKLNLTKDK